MDMEDGRGEEEEAMETEQGTRDVFSSAHKEYITQAVLHTLRNNGIASAGQQRGGGKGGIGTNGGKVFGLSLEDSRQERKMTESNGRPCYLPKFFVTSIEFLRGHVRTQGLFRKAGSCTRQKGLRLSLEEGASDFPLDTDPHDVASLLKQYLRELSVPLLTHSFSPLLLNCVQFFNDNANNQDTLSRTEAILMTCLLLPTQHLLCLQILFSLLHDVAAHSNESLMDSNSLAVVMAPNLFSSQETKKGKKQRVGGVVVGGGRGGGVVGGVGGGGPEDIKNMTHITTILIDRCHLIGQVPSVIETLSQELHARSLKTQYNMAAAAGGGSKTKSRKKTLSTRESVSSLLRGTLNKIRGGGGGENKPAADCSPGLSVEESPDGGLGPSACKRMALEDSSDLSDRATPNRSENSSSSSFSFNTNIRKRLFKGGSRKRYPFLRRGKKTVENVPLLLSCGDPDNTQNVHQQEDPPPNVDPQTPPPSPLLQTQTTPSTNLDLLTISPLTPSFSSHPPNYHPATPGGGGGGDLVMDSPFTATPPAVSVSDAVSVSPLSNNYKLVSRTRRTYVKNTATSSIRPCPSPYSFQAPAANVLPAQSQPAKLVRPVLTDHNLRKRRQVQFGGGCGQGRIELLPQPFSFTPIAAAATSRCVISSTPLERRPLRKAEEGGGRGRGDGHMIVQGILEPLTYQPCLNDTPETIGNNASYLRAVENGRDRETPLRRTTLHDTSSNNKSSSSRLVKTMRTSSMKVTPLQPTATTTGEESNRRGVRRCVVKSQSMSNRGIDTARSPWTNRKGIEVSEWII